MSKADSNLQCVLLKLYMEEERITHYYNYYSCSVPLTLLPLPLFSRLQRLRARDSVRWLRQGQWIKIPTHKRLKRTVFIRTKYSMRIFRVSPFFKLQTNAQTTAKRWKWYVGYLSAFVWAGFVMLFRCPVNGQSVKMALIAACPP